MSKTAIEWTEATWNPLAGCSEISPGCVNCYAMKMARRLAAMGQRKYAGTTRTLPNGKTTWTGKINLDPAALQIPLKTKKPTMYFVNSMSDLFHEEVPDSFIDEVFGTMALCPQHTFQVLTKRASRMESYFSGFRKSGLMPRIKTRSRDMPDGGILVWPLPNVWLGVSVENKKYGLPRIEHLLKTPAALRFLSIEPLLEDLGIELTGYLTEGGCANPSGPSREFFGKPRIDWCIIGGESGECSRPFNVGWARSIIRQCKEARVLCFVKQLGSNVVARNDDVSDWFDLCALSFEESHRPMYQGEEAKVVGFKNRKGGNPAEWPNDLRVREMPKASVP